MSTDRWKKVADLFEKAVCAPPSERDQLLQRECGDDDDLRRRVERLLENDAMAGEDFLVLASQVSNVECVASGECESQDSAKAVSNRVRDRFVGRRIGSYVIKQPIAEGGMGVVYLAQQDNPQREVALKILTAGFWSRSAHRRFEFETEILGRLHHPNIAQVYEADAFELEIGTAVPYFAMEYIPGAKAITEYCNKHQLDLRARLRMFCEVCEAVHYGHQKGVVHRDLKPANILIDESGHTKIIDFGVARSTDSDVATTTMHTEPGQLLGTLAYMSPEQVGGTATSPIEPGDVDTRSDVYSLGVVMFELLTERLPYDVSHMTIHAAAQVICNQEPRRPSTFDHRTRGDFETIILKAIAKDRSKRYNSAAALAEDIDRSLRGDPIAARPPTGWSKVARWAARRPKTTTAMLCSLILLLTVLASYTSVWYLSLRPYRIAVEQDGSAVRLLSRNRRELHSWPSTAKPGERIVGRQDSAVMIERASQLGGGKLAVIGFLQSAPSEEIRYPGQLCAYEVGGDVREPLWRLGMVDNDLPASLLERGRHADLCFPHVVTSVDVFADRPGDEIIAIFTLGSFSPRAICIADQQGKLLYRVWYDGSVSCAYWMSKPGLLVLTGDCEEEKERAQKVSSDADLRVNVVFALRPRVGVKSSEFVARDATDESRRPVWYKFAHPRASKRMPFSLAILRPDLGNSDRICKINFDFYAAVPPAGVWLNIDENGRQVGPFNKGDSYNHDQRSPNPNLPREDQIQLSDNPPALSDLWHEK